MTLNNHIGEYHIHRLLGKGATACVYLCQKKGEKPVAIKWLHEDNPLWIKRFQLECETLQKFCHPNIPQFVEQGTHAGRPYLVMEYIPGISGDIFAEKAQKLPPSERHQKCMLIGQQTAQVMWLLHQRNILHRDLKPSNIIITDQTTPVLLDFGTLKSTSHDVTLCSQFIGTPRYASPEQLAGEKLSGKSDQFSLGATLYYLLLHRRPFANRERETVIPPTSFDPSIPNYLEEIILRLLAFSPEERFHSMKDVAEAFSIRSDFGYPLAGRKKILESIAEVLSRAARGEQLVISLNGCRGIGKSWISQIIKRGALRQNITCIDILGHSQFEKAQQYLTKRSPLLLLTRCNRHQNFGIPVINIEIPFLSLAEIRRSVHGYAPKTKELSTLSEELHKITGGLPGLLLPLLERYTKDQRFTLPKKIELPEQKLFLDGLNWEDINILSVLALSSSPLSEVIIEKVSNISIEDRCTNFRRRGLIRKNQYGWYSTSTLFSQEILRLCPDVESLQKNLSLHTPSPSPSPISETCDDILQLAAKGHLAKSKMMITRHLEQSVSPRERAKILLTAGQIFLDLGDHTKANRYLSDATALGKSQNLWEYHRLAHSYRARISLEKHRSTSIGASLAIDRLLPLVKDNTHPITLSIWSWAVAALGDDRAWEKSQKQLLPVLSSLSDLDSLRSQFYFIQSLSCLGKTEEAIQQLKILLPRSQQYALIQWEVQRAYSLLTGTPPPITGPLAYGLHSSEILMLKKRWIYVKGKSPDPTWKD